MKLLIILLVGLIVLSGCSEEVKDSSCNYAYACHDTSYINSTLNYPEQLNYSCKTIHEMVTLDIYPTVTEVYYCKSCTTWREHYKNYHDGKEVYKKYYLENCLVVKG